jgi:hypothetical protein
VAYGDEEIMQATIRAALLFISLLVVSFLVFAIARSFPHQSTPPTPVSMPGFAGSALSLDNIANWPMCKDAKAGAKDAQDIDLSSVKGPTDRIINTNYHDCWYRVILPSREWRVFSKSNERMAFRYAFRISERRGQAYFSRGDGNFPTGEMTGPYFEFVALDSGSVQAVTW